MDEGEELTLAAPAFDHIIERPRLISAIEEADARFVLLCAPAGYGKTTLARQWSAREKRQPLWYRTTRASGDVAALAVRLDAMFAGAVGAPKNRDPNRIASIASVNPKPDPLGRALVSMYKRLPKTQLVVVDEYETADTPEAEELFGALVEGLPVRWLFTSRVRPAWFEPRMTVYGEAIELTADELTMTEEEAKSVLRRGKRRKADLAVLERARGWPAVLGLAAMSNEKPLPGETLMPKGLYEFLAQELLAAVSDELKQAVLVLAVASAASLEVARLLLGKQWRELLEQAAEQRLVAFGGSGDLSLHPLLRDVLLRELTGPGRRETVAERMTPLVRARRWDEALSASEVLGVGRFVTESLTAALEDLLHSGRTETLRRWSAVGESAQIKPELREYVEAELALRDGDFDKALSLAARSAARLTGQLAARAHLCAARAAHFSERREHATRHAKKAQALASNRRTRLDAVWARFTQAADVEGPDAAEIFTEFESIGDDSYETHLRLAAGRIILALTLGGDVDTALDEGRLARGLTGRGADPTVETAFLSVYSDLLCIRARYREAVETTKLALEVAKNYEIDFVHRYVLPLRSRALVGLRRFAEADRVLTELERIIKRQPDGFSETQAANARAGLYLSVGDPDRALDVLAFDPPPSVAAGQRGERLGLRALALAVKNHQAEALEEARRAEDTSVNRETKVLAAVTRAVLSLAHANHTAALEAADQAIRLDAYHQLLIAMRAAPELARLLAADPARREFITELLITSNDSALAHQAGLEVPRTAQRSDRLSPRELEIHGLIAQGLTNQEIAKILFIAPSTTKVHVHHVLEKLGVRSRVEAARLWKAPDED